MDDETTAEDVAVEVEGIEAEWTGRLIYDQWCQELAREHELAQKRGELHRVTEAPAAWGFLPPAAQAAWSDLAAYISGGPAARLREALRVLEGQTSDEWTQRLCRAALSGDEHPWLKS